jgi:hypothetical protein
MTRKLALMLFTLSFVVVAQVGLMASPAENAGLGIRSSAAGPSSMVPIRKVGSGSSNTTPGGGKLIASGLPQEPMVPGQGAEQLALVFLGISLFGFASYMRRRIPAEVANSASSGEAPPTAGFATIPQR